jgi:hypothetical protein
LIDKERGPERRLLRYLNIDYQMLAAEWVEQFNEPALPPQHE